MVTMYVTTFLLYVSGLTAKFVELLKVSEGKISEILTLQLRDLIKRSQPHIWCPEEPAHNAGAPSQLFQGILTLVKVALSPLHGMRTDKNEFLRKVKLRSAQGPARRGAGFAIVGMWKRYPAPSSCQAPTEPYSRELKALDIPSSANSFFCRCCVK